MSHYDACSYQFTFSNQFFENVLCIIQNKLKLKFYYFFQCDIISLF